MVSCGPTAPGLLASACAARMRSTNRRRRLGAAQESKTCRAAWTRTHAQVKWPGEEASASRFLSVLLPLRAHATGRRHISALLMLLAAAAAPLWPLRCARREGPPDGFISTSVAGARGRVQKPRMCKKRAGGSIPFCGRNRPAS